MVKFIGMNFLEIIHFDLSYFHQRLIATNQTNQVLVAMYGPAPDCKGEVEG
jgi:hypothetical protein